MRMPSPLISIILLSCSIINRAFVSASSCDMLTIIDNKYNGNHDPNDSMVKEYAFLDTAFVPALCEIIPVVCSMMRQVKERLFLNTGEFQARGPKDLIAIISTMLASLLGAILVKLNVLIVLSLISVGIGKLLLLILTFKTKIFSSDHMHQTHPPVVYEKVYYPRHQYHHIPDQEYPSEMHQEYSPYVYS